ncbi:MAG: DUF1559 domain-containing protein [Thermoguttaceae bacterium]|nr:DUF1559 domain-containing protein [Thermoguttaceae bacterium]MDW8079441.1 DUF1559 domain-containing protein [Thermoguttaceae bacterium]
MKRSRCHFRIGFTLVELLVVIAIIGILVALLLPAVNSAREAARRSQCTNNLKQLGLALHLYHDVYQVFPARSAGTQSGPVNNGGLLSGLVALLPYLEQKPLYDRIAAGDPAQGIPPWGPGTESSWSVWDVSPAIVRCPSDDGKRDGGETRIHNYCFSVGDSYQDLNDSSRDAIRGLFGHLVWYSAAHVTDGLSNTTAMSEHLRQGHGSFTAAARSIDHRRGTAIVQGLSSGNLPPNVAFTVTDGKYFLAGVTGNYRFGSRWVRGAPMQAAFNTILPPNGPCVFEVDPTGGWDYCLLPPSSNHPGGANVLFADGSVRFISDTIDTGNLGVVQGKGYKGPSNYGVWGALGSRGGGEGVSAP